MEGCTCDYEMLTNHKKCAAFSRQTRACLNMLTERVDYEAGQEAQNARACEYL